MFIKEIRKMTVPLVIAVLFLPSLSLASFDSVLVEIDVGAYILNGDSTEGRVLLRFDLPDGLSNAELFFAELVVPITSYIPDSSALRILMHPLLISWDRNVSWNDIGDTMNDEIIAEDGTHYAATEEGNQEAHFNITRFVTAWTEESISNNGVILFYSSDEAPYFRYNRSNDAPFARVKVYYDR